MARNIESVVNIGLLLAPVKAEPASRGLIGKAGLGIRKSGVRSAGKNKRQYVEELVQPEQLLKQRRAQV